MGKVVGGAWRSGRAGKVITPLFTPETCFDTLPGLPRRPACPLNTSDGHTHEAIRVADARHCTPMVNQSAARCLLLAHAVTPFITMNRRIDTSINHHACPRMIRRALLFVVQPRSYARQRRCPKEVAGRATSWRNQRPNTRGIPPAVPHVVVKE